MVIMMLVLVGVVVILMRLKPGILSPTPPVPAPTTPSPPLHQVQSVQVPGSTVPLNLGMSGGEFDEDAVREQLRSVDISNGEIDDFFEWLEDSPRSSQEILTYLQNLL